MNTVTGDISLTKDVIAKLATDLSSELNSDFLEVQSYIAFVNSLYLDITVLNWKSLAISLDIDLIAI